MKRFKVIRASLVLAAALLLAWATPGTGEQPVPTTQAEPETVVRTYDVADLLVSIRDYPAAGSLKLPNQLEKADAAQPGQTAPSLFDRQQQQEGPSREMAAAALRDTIVSTIDSSSWKDNGGNVGTILTQTDCMTITVTQTPANQTAIEHLLADLRKPHNRSVRVRADWVLCTHAELDKLLKKGRADTAVFPEVDRGALLNLPDSIPRFSAEATGINGHRFSLATGQPRSVITMLTPVVAVEAAATQPTVDYVQYDSSLQVCPVLGPDSATVDVHLVASEPPDAATTKPSMPGLDAIGRWVQSFQSTVLVPLNTPVMVEEATLDPTLTRPAGKELVLVLEVDAAK